MSESYSTETVDTQGIINFAKFLAAICFLTFLFDTETVCLLQLLYLHYFVSSTYPLAFSSILTSFKLATVSWIPNMLQFAVPDFIRHNYVPAKIIDVLEDYLFIRSGGYFFTVFILVLLAFIILKIMSIPEINRFKNLRMWCKETLDERWKLSIPMQIFTVLYTPLVYYFFLNMREYSQTGNQEIASIVVSWIFFFIYISILLLSLIKVVTFFRNHPKLSINITKATNMILQEDEYHQLHSQNMFLFDMKKIDLRDLLYPKVNGVNILPFKCIYSFNQLSLLCPSVQSIRVLLMAIILVAGQGEPILQTSLLIVVNVAMCLYMIRARPYRFKYRRLRLRNYIAIFN